MGIYRYFPPPFKKAFQLPRSLLFLNYLRIYYAFRPTNVKPQEGMKTEDMKMTHWHKTAHFAYGKIELCVVWAWSHNDRSTVGKLSIFGGKLFVTLGCWDASIDDEYWTALEFRVSSLCFLISCSSPRICCASCSFVPAVESTEQNRFAAAQRRAIWTKSIC